MPNRLSARQKEVVDHLLNNISATTWIELYPRKQYPRNSRDYAFLNITKWDTGGKAINLNVFKALLRRGLLDDKGLAGDWETFRVYTLNRTVAREYGYD